MKQKDPHTNQHNVESFHYLYRIGWKFFNVKMKSPSQHRITKQHTTIGLPQHQHSLPFIYILKRVNGTKRKIAAKKRTTTTAQPPSNSLRWLFILVSRLRLIVELFHLHLFFLSKCVRSHEMCISALESMSNECRWWCCGYVAVAGVAIGFGILPCSRDSMVSNLKWKEKICWEKQKE